MDTIGDDTKRRERGFFEGARYFVVIVLLWLMTVVAAFEAGVIFEHYRMDDYSKRFAEIELTFSELVMKVAAHETILGIGKKGRSGLERKKPPTPEGEGK